MNTQDIQDLIMSYVVDVTYSPNWYVNAWMDAYYKSGDQIREGGDQIREGNWNRSYPDYVYNWSGSSGPNTITFPDEQTYIMFLLRWS
jgi:hypothetical protein